MAYIQRYMVPHLTHISILRSNMGVGGFTSASPEGSRPRFQADGEADACDKR